MGMWFGVAGKKSVRETGKRVGLQEIEGKDRPVTRETHSLMSACEEHKQKWGRLCCYGK